MNQVDYVAAVWRRKWMILAAVVVGAAGALVATVFAGSTYRSTAVVKVMMTMPGALSGETDASGTGAQDFVTLANQLAFRDEVVREIKSGYKPQNADEVSAEALQDPKLLTVSGISPSREGSKRLADAAVELLKQKSAMLFAGPEGARTELEFSLLEPLAAEINTLRQQQLRLQLRRRSVGRGTAGDYKYSSRINRLTWRLSNLQRSYASYSDYLSRVALDEAIGRQNLAVVSRPILPVRASRANVATNMAIGALLGALLGIALAVFMEAAGRSVSTTPAPAQSNGTASRAPAQSKAAAAPASPSPEARRPTPTSVARQPTTKHPSGRQSRTGASPHIAPEAHPPRPSDAELPRTHME